MNISPIKRKIRGQTEKNLPLRLQDFRKSIAYARSHEANINNTAM